MKRSGNQLFFVKASKICWFKKHVSERCLSACKHSLLQNTQTAWVYSRWGKCVGVFLSFCLQQPVTFSIKVLFLIGRQQWGFYWNPLRKDWLISHGGHRLQYQQTCYNKRFTWFPKLVVFMVVFYYYLQAGCLTTVIAPFLGLCHISHSYQNTTDCGLLSGIKIAHL